MSLINKNSSLFNNVFEENNIFKADIYEKNDDYKIVLDLPGFEKDNIRVEYCNGYLNVRAILKDDSKDKTNFLHRERFYGEYKRTFYVGCTNEDDIRAKYQNGLLVITLKKQCNDDSKNVNVE